jgi:hypothetical protein
LSRRSCAYGGIAARSVSIDTNLTPSPTVIDAPHGGVVPDWLQQ